LSNPEDTILSLEAVLEMALGWFHGNKARIVPVPFQRNILRDQSVLDKKIHRWGLYFSSYL
jgi:hypothetical protein